MIEITVREKETGKVLLEKEGLILAGYLFEAELEEEYHGGTIIVANNAPTTALLATAKQLEKVPKIIISKLFEED